MKSKLAVVLLAVLGFAATTFVFAQDAMKADEPVAAEEPMKMEEPAMGNTEMMNNTEMAEEADAMMNEEGMEAPAEAAPEMPAEETSK